MGSKGFFMCKEKGCTSDVEYEEPKDCKCEKCGSDYIYKDGYVKAREFFYEFYCMECGDIIGVTKQRMKEHSVPKSDDIVFTNNASTQFKDGNRLVCNCGGECTDRISWVYEPESQ